MPDKDAGTPRVFLYRHGETEWSKSGRYTGTSEILLTADGEEQVLASGKILAGRGKLMDPAKIARVFISPRQRAARTFELAFNDGDKALLKEAGKVVETERLAEWGSPAEVTARIDSLIGEIRAIHKDNMHGENPSDVVLIAHGHTLRAFTKRWLGYPMEFPLSMMLEPGAVGVLSYQHHSIDEPAFLVGYGFPLEQ
ncbi:hypothetical protein BBP40_003356 [Aspergillus hancockii]|nr:hypothetical protein BBP40_003356 [Aspergillus hancockii]